MISGHYRIGFNKWQALTSMVLRGAGICALGLSLGLAVFNMTHFPTQMLVATGAGLLLLVFPISPARFLLAYLIALPFLDALIPFFTTELFGLQFGPQILFRGGLIVLLVYYWVINQRSPLAFRPAIPMFMLLLLLALSTLASGIRTQLGLITLAKHAYWIFLLPTVADMVKQGTMKLETIYRCMIISTLGFIVVVLASPYLGTDLGSFYGVGDARGPYGPHSLALCLCLGFIVVLAFCTKRPNKFFLLLLLFFGVAIVISIARTYARTGYTSLFTSLLVFASMVWRYGKKEAALRRQRLILGLTFVIIIGVFIAYSLIYSGALVERIRDFSSIETAGAGRTMIYQAALKRYAGFSIFRQVFGGGLGSIHFLLGLYVPHNDYLVLLLAGGLLGLALHLWSLVGLYRQIVSTARATYLPLIIAGSAMAALIVATMTNPVIGYMSVMTYFCFLVGGAMGHYSKQTL